MLFDTSGVLEVMRILKRSYGQLLVVIDDYGTLKGIVTPIDILEAIAGEFSDEDEQLAIQQLKSGCWQVDGAIDLHLLEQELGTDFLASEDEVNSLAGFLLARFGKLPNVGDVIELQGFRFDILEIVDRRVATVRISKLN